VRFTCATSLRYVTGAAAVLFVLALEHRLPNVYTIMGWMDHGTLALLWGMMIIVSLLVGLCTSCIQLNSVYP
jgi:hypothetical protein